MFETIFGFRQEYVVKYKLDLKDLAFLTYFQWFKDTKNMKTKIINGEVYYWVYYNSFLEAMPCTGIRDKSGLRKRLKKLCDKEVLDFVLDKNDGNYTYYKPGIRFNNLLPAFKSEAPDENPIGKEKNPNRTGKKSDTPSGKKSDTKRYKYNKNIDIDHLYDEIDNTKVIDNPESGDDLNPETNYMFDETLRLLSQTNMGIRFGEKEKCEVLAWTEMYSMEQIKSAIEAAKNMNAGSIWYVSKVLKSETTPKKSKAVLEAEKQAENERKMKEWFAELEAKGEKPF